MNRQNRLAIPPILLLLLAVGLAGCTTGAPPAPAPGAPLGLGPSATPAAAVVAPAVPAAPPAVPWLSGMPPQEQLRILKWILTVSDHRRLVTLFEDLHEQRNVDLEERGATARQRLEGLVAGLERAGHRVPQPARGFTLDRLEENAPPPNTFPLSVVSEPQRKVDDPDAARALEEARQAAQERGTRPPGH